MIREQVSRFTWSPIIYKENTRKQANFLKSVIIALDFDDGEMTLAQAVDNYFCDVRHIIGTTRSHQLEKNGIICDRFRVILQLEKPITTAREYRWQMKCAVKRYPIDPQATDAARLFYPCNEIVSVSDGELWEVHDVPSTFENYEHKDKELAVYKDLKKIPYQVECTIYSHVPKLGTRNNFIFALFSDLQKLGVSYEKSLELFKSSAAFETYKADEDFVRSSLRTILARYKEL